MIHSQIIPPGDETAFQNNKVLMALDWWASLPLEALLLLDGPYRLGNGLEPASGYWLPAVVGEPVSSVFDLLQRPVDLPEAALGLLTNGGVHLAGEHILAHVA